MVVEAFRLISADGGKGLGNALKRKEIRDVERQWQLGDGMVQPLHPDVIRAALSSHRLWEIEQQTGAPARSFYLAVLAECSEVGQFIGDAAEIKMRCFPKDLFDAKTLLARLVEDGFVAVVDEFLGSYRIVGWGWILRRSQPAGNSVGAWWASNSPLNPAGNSSPDALSLRASPPEIPAQEIPKNGSPFPGVSSRVYAPASLVTPAPVRRVEESSSSEEEAIKEREEKEIIWMGDMGGLGGKGGGSAKGRGTGSARSGSRSARDDTPGNPELFPTPAKLKAERRQAEYFSRIKPGGGWTKGKRAPRELALSTTMLRFAIDRGLTKQEAQEAFESMKDHEFKDPRRDWDGGVWKNWVRTTVEWKRRAVQSDVIAKKRSGNGYVPAAEQTMRMIQNVLDRQADEEEARIAQNEFLFAPVGKMATVSVPAEEDPNADCQEVWGEE